MFNKKKKNSAHLMADDRAVNNDRSASQNTDYDKYLNEADNAPMPETDFQEDEYDSIGAEGLQQEYGDTSVKYPNADANETAEERSSRPEEKNNKNKKGKKEKLPKKEKMKKEKPVREKKHKAEKEKPDKTEAPSAEPDSAHTKKKGFKKLKIILIVVVAVLLLAAGGAAVGGYYVTQSTEILPNVYIDGIAVGKMSPEAALQELEKNGWDEKTALALRVELPGGVSFKLDRCKAGAVFTKNSAVKAAFRYGHGENIFDNLFKFIGNTFFSVDVADYLQMDEEYIRRSAAEGIEKFKSRTSDSDYVIDNHREILRMKKGAGEMEINEDALCTEIAAALEKDQTRLEYRHIDSQLTQPDFEKLHTELSVEPENAYFEEDFSVVDEVVGCDFDTDLAAQLWHDAAPAEMIRIPLKIDYPEKTGEYLRSLIYRDKLGSQTTFFTYSSDDRINNIDLAAAKIDGIVLMPGEVFSYNDTVGKRTEEAGFKPAGAYSDGEVVQEVGGGICQVSSTLYCAAMFAQLDTVERTNHYFKVNYLDYGYDATVSWPGPDYKFKNSREYPVKISAYTNHDDKSLTIEIWGTDVDGSYVELTHNQLCVYHDQYPDVVIGFGVSAFRNVYDKDGNFLYQVEEPYGIYNKHKEDIHLPEAPSEGGYEADVTVEE